jgi:hypothetical protein
LGFALRIFFRPEWGLDGAGALMPDIGQYARPMVDAAFGAFEAGLGLLQLAFGVAQFAAVGSLLLCKDHHAGRSEISE